MGGGRVGATVGGRGGACDQVAGFCVGFLFLFKACGKASNLRVYPIECLLLRLQRVSSPLVLSKETGH